MSEVQNEIDRLRARAENEKKWRIYYQNIVYAVCRELDKMIPGVTVCGTLLEPSSDVELRNGGSQGVVAGDAGRGAAGRAEAGERG
jgi:hypothetical protein